MIIQSKWVEPLLNIRLWIPPAVMAIFLVVISQYNYLTFHTLAELFAIVISFLVFAFAWSTRGFSTNNFLLFLACGYFWIGSLDLMHTLVYKEMNVFVEGSGNLSVQFWIGTRYSEALLLLAAPFAAARKQNGHLLIVVFGAVAVGLTALIFSGHFPIGFVEGTGLTDFKIYSEYLIDLILVLALIAVLRLDGILSVEEKALISVAIVMTMCAELAFTFYVDVDGTFNLAGHIFKIFSFWMIFQAIVISNLKKPYAELLEAKEVAEKANEAKSDFLSSMSHEFRTPLNAILGYAQILQIDPKAPLSPAQNEHVESILSGSNRLLRLVNELLDLTGNGANYLDLTIEEIDCRDVIADCTALIAPLAESRNVKIVADPGIEPSALLRTDRSRFKQVLINLLTNAVRFNKDGGTVTVKYQEVDNGFLRISVKDTGIGISKEDRPRVFQIFHRIGADATKARAGAGIGLNVAKLLVERMAGRIGFESEEGAGSTFWIELPLASNEDVLIWTDTMNIGIDAIDRDHQVLVSLLNKVSHENLDGAAIDTILDELIVYTDHHFQREEAIMGICGYPDLEEHRGCHRDIAVQVGDLAETWRESHDPELLKHLRTLMKDWFFDHVINTDAKMSRYATGKGRDIRKALGDLK